MAKEKGTGQQQEALNTLFYSELQTAGRVFNSLLDCSVEYIQFGQPCVTLV